ncbi:MAG: glycosyltransferase family 9 protein [bacterium]|nr:glycosyltransferase family 9 protein [bacterium]
MDAPLARARSIICMCLSGIGDALTFTPFLVALKSARPQLAIDVLVMFRSAEALFQSHPAVRHTFFINFLGQSPLRSLRDVLRLRAYRYDASVVALPANRWEYNIIQTLLCSRTVGHRYHHLDLPNLNFIKRYWVWEDENRHVVEQNLDLLQFFGVPRPSDPGPLSLHLTPQDHALAQSWLTAHAASHGPLIAFHPGSATFKNHIMKRWPASSFATLARTLVDQRNATILVFGTPDEDQLKHSISILSQRPTHVIPVNGTPLRVSAALIKRCSLMICNDAALMHVAAAVQTPVVAIFAYTNYRSLYPWHVPHRIVRRDLPCSPCFYYSPRPAFCHARLNYTCIRDLPVEDVLHAANQLLDASPPPTLKPPIAPTTFSPS